MRVKRKHSIAFAQIGSPCLQEKPLNAETRLTQAVHLHHLIFHFLFTSHWRTLLQCKAVGKTEWTTFPGRLIISWILSACSLWWALTEGLTGENDVLFSAGITVQVPLRRLLLRYEVYINYRFLDPRGSTREEKLVEQGKWVTPRSKWSCWETLKYRARMCALCQSLNTYKQRQHTHFKASTNSRHTWNEVQQMTCRVESLTLLQIFHHWDKHLLHKAQGCTAQRPSEALTYTLKVSVLIWSLNENMQICSNK